MTIVLLISQVIQVYHRPIFQRNHNLRSQLDAILGQDRHLAYAYVKPVSNRVGTEFELQVPGEPRRAVIVEQCMYDPRNLLPRADV